MFLVTTVVQAARGSLPSGGGDDPSSDGDPTLPTSSVPTDPSDVFKELGVRPENYIIQLCHLYDGRMKQQAVVEQTGWSEPTVSRFLSDMEADGHIDRMWLGREKVVALPGRLPGTSGAAPNPG